MKNRAKMAKEYSNLVHRKHRLEEQIEDKKAEIENHWNDPNSWAEISGKKTGSGWFLFIILILIIIFFTLK